MREIGVVYREVALLVEGTYTKGEDSVFYDSDLGGYPGSSSEFDINAIYVGGIDIYELFYSEQLDEISEVCLISIED